MIFETTSNSLSEISADAAVAFVFSNKDKIVKTESFNVLDKALAGILSEVIESDNFKAETGNFLTVHSQKKILSNKVYILGLGKEEKLDLNVLRRAVSMLSKSIKKKDNSIALSLLGSQVSKLEAILEAQVIAEGLLLGSYTFSKYKKQDEKGKNLETVIFSEKKESLKKEIDEGVELAKIYYEGTKLARDLVNEQAAVVNPTYLANLASDIAKKDKNIKVKIFDKDELVKIGMDAFLGVARGSDTPPKFIYLEYTPEKSSKRKIAIVGKGITFDTGGVNVKPGDHMNDMKMDMAGAATVLGIFSVISYIKPSFIVMGLIAATPNLISGKALVPGDVLKALNGKTIEIGNTDAEGRVTLADSLSYSVKKGATEIIDFATLTGANIVALGPDFAGLFSNNQDLAEKVKAASFGAGEKVWEMPLPEEYKKMNKSEVADISNIPNTRYGGAITAALFLQEFIDNKPWVHLDIAGPAFAEGEYDLGPKGGTGFGVRTILNFLKEN